MGNTSGQRCFSISVGLPLCYVPGYNFVARQAVGALKHVAGANASKFIYASEIVSAVQQKMPTNTTVGDVNIGIGMS